MSSLWLAYFSPPSLPPLSPLLVLKELSANYWQQTLSLCSQVAYRNYVSADSGYHTAVTMWRCLWFNADFLYSWSYHVPPPPPSPSPPSPSPLMCVHVCGGQRATFRHCPLISLFLPHGGRLSCHFWLPHCFWEILFPLSPSQLGMLALQCTSLYLALIFLMWVLEHRLSDWYGKLFWLSVIVVCFFCCFWHRVSRILWWLCTHNLAEDDLEFLIILPQVVAQCWHCRPVPSWLILCDIGPCAC